VLRLALVTLLLVTATSCHRRARAVRAAPAGLPGVPLQQRQTAYSQLGGETESTPYAVPHDAILDEATLYVQPDQVCANVVLRQPMGFDEPLSQLNMRCSADGRYKERTYAQQEQPPSERDYPFTGPPPMLRVRGPHGWFSIPIGQAQANYFRVVERSFQVCCPFTASSVFRLTIDGQSRYSDYVRTDFAWRLR
jgi:hypothetical protein